MVVEGIYVIHVIMSQEFVQFVVRKYAMIVSKLMVEKARKDVFVKCVAINTKTFSSIYKTNSDSYINLGSMWTH